MHTTSPAWSGALARFKAMLRSTLVASLTSLALAGAGYLGPGDEQLASGEYFDRVTFTGAAGDEVLVGVSSTEFDPYVIVVDATDNVLVQQGDGPGVGTNVRLALTLPSSGQFTVIVTSELPGEVGGYALTLAAPNQVASSGGLGKAGPTAPAPGARPATAAAPRTVTGTALDTFGRPIAGARVRIVPALTTGMVEVRTDANGRYVAEGLLDVPYRAQAWTFVEYGGEQLCLRLGMESPTDFDTFVPTDGAVRNFRLQLTGPIEDLRDTKEQFGAVLAVMDAWPYEDHGNRIELTFAPTGPLVDGSTIEPFVRVFDPDRDTIIRGLPLAPYRVSATLIEADGARLALGISPDTLAEPAAAANVDFTGDGECDLGSGVEWEYVYLGMPL